MVAILNVVLFVLVEKVERVLHVFGEVKNPRTEREFEGLECFHEDWINAVPARGARLLARRKEPLTSNRGSLCREDVHREPEEVREPPLSTLHKRVRIVN